MTRAEYETLDCIMQGSIPDSAHDAEHVHRVLRSSLAIAEGHPEVDMDVLFCTTSDLARRCAIRRLPRGGGHGNGLQTPDRIRLGRGAGGVGIGCDPRHRYRGGATPETIEERSLYDADKPDVTGAMGVARTLMYQGRVYEPLYRVNGGRDAGRARRGAELHE